MKGRILRGGALLATAGAFAAVLAPSGVATSTLSASKTAEASWTRSFTWTIDKSVTPASHDMQTGESGDSTYTIVVNKSDPVDTDVTVEGEVCVQNNGTTATEDLAIRDRIAVDVPGGTLTLDVGFLDVSGNPVLDAGESHCYPYSFIIEPRSDAIAYRNEAQVTISNGQGAFPSASFTIPREPTLVNDEVNVDDTNGMSWLFSDSGQVTYTKTFTCDEDAGEHKNTATIRETGASDDATVTVRCTPPPDPGCTYTQGYWKTHSVYGPAAKPDPTWNLLPSGANTTFFLSGKSWYQVFWTPPAGGNAYYILAHQYMAARLNILAGATTTTAVDNALAWATTFFSTYTPSSTLPASVKSAAKAYAGTLADYNEGDIGPGHCDD